MVLPQKYVAHHNKDPPTTDHKQSVFRGICWMKCTPLIPFVKLIPQKKLYKKKIPRTRVRPQIHGGERKKENAMSPNTHVSFCQSPKGTLNLISKYSISNPFLYFPINPPSSFPSKFTTPQPFPALRSHRRHFSAPAISAEQPLPHLPSRCSRTAHRTSSEPGL